MDHYLHRKRRAAVSPFFSQRSIDATVPTFYRNVDLLCTALRYYMKRGDALDIRAAYLAYSTESVCNSAFGGSLDLLRDPALSKARDWKRTMEAVGNITPLAKQFSWTVKYALQLPVAAVRLVNEDLARLLILHKVGDGDTRQTSKYLLPLTRRMATRTCIAAPP